MPEHVSKAARLLVAVVIGLGLLPVLLASPSTAVTTDPAQGVTVRVTGLSFVDDYDELRSRRAMSFVNMAQFCRTTSRREMGWAHTPEDGYLFPSVVATIKVEESAANRANHDYIWVKVVPRRALLEVRRDGRLLGTLNLHSGNSRWVSGGASYVRSAVHSQQHDPVMLGELTDNASRKALCGLRKKGLGGPNTNARYTFAVKSLTADVGVSVEKEVFPVPFIYKSRTMSTSASTQTVQIRRGAVLTKVKVRRHGSKKYTFTSRLKVQDSRGRLVNGPAGVRVGFFECCGGGPRTITTVRTRKGGIAKKRLAYKPRYGKISMVGAGGISLRPPRGIAVFGHFLGGTGSQGGTKARGHWTLRKVKW